MKKITFILLLVSMILIGAANASAKAGSMDVLVLLNTNSPQVSKAKEKLLPYLDHFGVPYSVVDLGRQNLPASVVYYALVIVSHSRLAAGDSRLKDKLDELLTAGVKAGTGLVSFDPDVPGAFLKNQSGRQSRPVDVGELKFSPAGHFITALHKPVEILELFGVMQLARFSAVNADVLVSGSNYPLLVAASAGKGRVAQFTSQDWMYRSVLGPMGGLDDLLWRSIVWAARKPFAMRLLPPIVTMRIDDVVGSGGRWNQTPFFWIKTANKYGFKPWLALFIYNLNPQAVEELRGYILDGQAAWSPHAFGRPPRPESDAANFEADYKYQMVPNHFIPDYYYPKALPYRSKFYDEFIFYNHNDKESWPDEVASENLKAIDKWCADNQPLPMSKYLIAHWGEMGSNCIPHIADKWRIEFIAAAPLDWAWGQPGPGIKSGPFRLYEEPVYGKPKKVRVSHPRYNADFVELAGRKFFNCSTVIADITGYEWKPDNDDDGTADRGIRILTRALNARALAVLFTHETDYLFRIEPKNWDRELKLVSEGIADYNPIYLTMDDALRIVRAHRTSKMKSCTYEASSGTVEAELVGSADVPTGFYLFTRQDDNITSALIKVPPFEGGTVVRTVTGKGI